MAREARYASPVITSKAELLKAAAENRPELLMRWLNEGGGLDEARNDERQSVLHIAAMEGADDCVSLLLQSHKVLRKINTRDRGGRSALHLSAAMGYEGCVQRLLEANATLDLQDDKGCTPLHLSVKFEWPETARALLDAGADPLLEDVNGVNAVDMANSKGDGDAASLIASFARRRHPSALGQLKRCLLPNFFFGGSRRPHADPVPTPDGASSPTEPGRLPPPSMVGAPRSYSPERQAHARPYAGFDEDGFPDQSPVSAAPALSPAVEVASRQPGPEEIEWQGLEPVVVERGAAEAPAAPSPLAAALEADAGHRGRGRSPAVAEDLISLEPSAPAPAQARTPSVPPAREPDIEPEGVGEAEPASDGESEEFAMFRLHAFFEEGVKRLEFEVEWKEGQPSVGAVKPKGEAARRGIVSGDCLVEIAGAKTSGKGREELLPLLKTRPLLLKIDREERVLDPQEPHLELDLKIRWEEGEDSGVEVSLRGQLPVASTVRPGSAAWRSGVLEGDAIVRLDGKPTSEESKSALQSAMNGRPKSLSVWRRPQGVDLGAPWQVRASIGGS